MILGGIQNFSCQTVTFPQTRDNRYGNLDTSPFFFRVRLLYTSTGSGSTGGWLVDTCRSYRDLTNELGFEFDEDRMTKAVQLFAVFAACLGGLSMILICLVPCHRRRNSCRWKTYGGLLMCTGVAQGLTLLVTRSSICTNNPVLQVFEDAGWSIRNTFGDECQTSAGFNCGICATALWLSTGAVMFCLPPPPHVDEDWVTSFGYWAMPKIKNPKKDEQPHEDDD
jgi:hypothetical protein